MEINFEENKWDQLVEKLTRQGFTADVIARETGLSLSQIYTRRHRLKEETGFSVVDFRNGRNTDAQELIHKCEKMLGWIKALKITSKERRQRYLDVSGKRSRKRTGYGKELG